MLVSFSFHACSQNSGRNLPKDKPWALDNSMIFHFELPKFRFPKSKNEKFNYYTTSQQLFSAQYGFIITRFRKRDLKKPWQSKNPPSSTFSKPNKWQRGLHSSLRMNNYPPEVWHGPWKVTFPIGKLPSNHHFSAAMLNFGGGVDSDKKCSSNLDHETPIFEVKINNISDATT